MKKLFTLVALLACFLGAKAEWVEDYKIDYSTHSGFPFYVMGYVPEWFDGVMTDFGAMYKYVAVEGAEETSDVIVKTEAGVDYYKIATAEPTWHQYFIADGIPTQLDGTYTITAMVKASEACSINVNMGWGWGDGQQKGASVSIGTDWQEVTWEYSGIGGTSCNLVAQPGTVTATIEWKWVSVTHFDKPHKPVVWIEMLENGDAEKSWTEMGLADVRFDDMDNNFKVCAWGKEKGRNMNENDGWDPFPADIEEVDGSHVFVVHGKPATTEGDPSAWDNQFWIQSPQEWKPGTQLKIHFRYKASQPVKTNTQIHHQTPSDYMHWQAIGDINFTTEWQEYDQVVSWPSGGDDKGWSIAFNLNPEVKDAVDFYWDDLSWSQMQLEEGFFVAGSNPTDGLEYDFDNAVQFEMDDEGIYVATIGAPGEYVSQVMISTVRGNDAAFKSATLKPSGTIHNDPDEWLDYTESSLAKLNLPGAGIWKIYIDDYYRAMAFEMLEGTIIEQKEIKPNPTEVIVHGQERDDLSDGENVREEEGGTGETWDNQFFLVANRTLSAGEVTVIQFKYKSSIDAKTTTQCHKEPGAYLHWGAIGDVNFTTEWQDFETTFTVPGEADGMQTIAFNMAEIKAACDYQMKDFVWKLEDNTQTLINETGSENFFVKEGAGTAPYMYVDPAGISSIVSNSNVSNATYNLAGQRVTENYKGIVIKNGKKYIAK